jgi:hypothetical protein
MHLRIGVPAEVSGPDTQERNARFGVRGLHLPCLLGETGMPEEGSCRTSAFIRPVGVGPFTGLLAMATSAWVVPTSWATGPPKAISVSLI